MRIFLSLNQNRIVVKSVLDETVLGEELLYVICEWPLEENLKKNLKWTLSIFQNNLTFRKIDKFRYNRQKFALFGVLMLAKAMLLLTLAY